MQGRYVLKGVFPHQILLMMVLTNCRNTEIEAHLRTWTKILAASGLLIRRSTTSGSTQRVTAHRYTFYVGRVGWEPPHTLQVMLTQTGRDKVTSLSKTKLVSAITRFGFTES